MGIIPEFKEFLKEYKVMGLAVGIIIGLAATKAKISKNNTNWLEKYNPFNIIKSILNYEK